MPPAPVAVEWQIRVVAEPEEIQNSTEQVAHWEDSGLSTRTLNSLHQELQEEIARATDLLSLQEEFEGDEEGVALSKPALDIAVTFLKKQSAWLWRSCGHKMPVPTIGPGPDGSTDLYWKRSSWELLVNLPADPDCLATYYGHDSDGSKSKGSFDPTVDAVSLLPWLMN